MKNPNSISHQAMLAVILENTDKLKNLIVIGIPSESILLDLFQIFDEHVKIEKKKIDFKNQMQVNKYLNSIYSKVVKKYKTVKN